MKITLITPPVRMEELHPKFASRKNWFWDLLIGEHGLLAGFKPVSGRQPPFGLLFLSAQLKKHNHKVTLLDGYFHSHDSMFSALRKDYPDIVGIGSMTYNWEKAKVLASKIKEMDRGIKIIVGGKHPTVWGETCFDESESIDFVVQGEAEEILVDLVKCIEDGSGRCEQ